MSDTTPQENLNIKTMIEYKPINLKCIGGHDFIFSAKEQAFFAQHAWPQPIRCIECRKANKERYKKQPWRNNKLKQTV